MEILLLILGFLSVRSQCVPINPLSSTSQTIEAHGISGQKPDFTDGLTLEHRPWHKLGQSYSEEKLYFGFELPENRTGWIERGSGHTDHWPTYLSIDSARHRPRNGVGSYFWDHTHFAEGLPSGCECCQGLTGTLRCRTYQLKPKSITPRQHELNATTAYTLSDGASTRTSNLVPRRQDGHHHHHKPGHPYSKDVEYFGYELPKDTAGWVATGNSEISHHIHKAPKYRSINSATGKPREGGGDCLMVKGEWHIEENWECCRLMISIVCRTYKFEPTYAGNAILTILSPQSDTSEIMASEIMP